MPEYGVCWSSSTSQGQEPLTCDLPEEACQTEFEICELPNRLNSVDEFVSSDPKVNNNPHYQNQLQRQISQGAFGGFSSRPAGGVGGGSILAYNLPSLLAGCNNKEEKTGNPKEKIESKVKTSYKIQMQDLGVLGQLDREDLISIQYIDKYGHEVTPCKLESIDEFIYGKSCNRDYIFDGQRPELDKIYSFLVTLTEIGKLKKIGHPYFVEYQIEWIRGGVCFPFPLETIKKFDPTQRARVDENIATSPRKKALPQKNIGPFIRVDQIKGIKFDFSHAFKDIKTDAETQ